MSFRMTCNSACSLMLVALALCPAVVATEPGSRWSRFRGPNGAGVQPNCHVPLPWSDDDVAWELKLPGKGNGSPVVFDNQVFVMSAEPDSAARYLLAIDLKSGTEIWRKTYASTPHRLHRQSSYASCTPCVDGNAVYFTWAAPENVVLKALSHQGEERWSRDLGSYLSQHGFGASPVVYDDKVILFDSQQAEQLPPNAAPGVSRVLAFDAATGNPVWETPRTTTRVCYGSPSRFKTDQGIDALLFSNTGDGLFALELDSGKPLWNTRVFGKRCVSSPQVIGDLAIGTEGSGGGGNILVAVDIRSDQKVKFRINRAAPYVPTPVSKDGLLFLWDDKGIVTCVRLPNGEVVWSKRVGGNVSASPVIAGDKLIGVAEDGTVTLLSASPEFKKLGSIKLGDITRATPLLAENYVLLRTNSKLICVGKP